jgi:uncharacterized protein (TIGR02301 family)
MTAIPIRLILVAILTFWMSSAPVLAAPNDPPYEASLQRLAEILGALHYLRPLCGAAEGNIWRDQMDELLKAEEPAPDRKAMLVSRFNRGFSSFQALYRSCTPAAIAAIDRYMAEGSTLTGDIATRYGR